MSFFSTSCDKKRPEGVHDVMRNRYSIVLQGVPKRDNKKT